MKHCTIKLPNKMGIAVMVKKHDNSFWIPTIEIDQASIILIWFNFVLVIGIVEREN